MRSYRTLKANKLPVVFAVLFGVAGLVYLAVSNAATQSAAIEPELATLGTNTSVVNDVTASGGKAVKFDAAVVTPPPTTSTLKGWELTATNVGLAPFGLNCASLPAYTGPSVVPAGTTITQKRVTVPLNVEASNIVIDKSCLRPTSLYDGHVTAAWGSNVIIKDSEIDGSGMTADVVATACGIVGNFQLYRNYVHDVGSGICVYGSGITYNGIIENNYVHKLRHAGDAHHEAATVRDFKKNAANTRSVVWTGNRLNSDSTNVSGGLFIQPTFEDIHNVTVQDNLLEGNGFNLWLEIRDGVYSNMRAINNRFQGGTNYYGPASVQSGVGWIEWRDNYVLNLSNTDGKGAVVNNPN